MILILDNYDSFTFNLFQAIGAITGREPEVRRNDEIDLEGIRRLGPTHIVLSPGPGSPDRARDFGVCKDVILALSTELPILGVCLGHQGIIHHLGGRVIRAPEIVHGKVWPIRIHPGSSLLGGVGSEIRAMRYHSLVGERATLPAELVVTAETAEGLIMAVEHRQRPLFGIQFHPESIGTPVGPAILERFLSFTPATRPAA